MENEITLLTRALGPAILPILCTVVRSTLQSCAKEGALG